MKLYVFSSLNWENIWIGYRMQKWAVSPAQAVMQARRTRARSVRVGDRGLLYTRKGPHPVLTMPFEFKTAPNIDESVPDVWPEVWVMPFDIRTLGAPDRQWNARHAAQILPFNKEAKTNLSSVFNMQGTAVFAPIEIGEDDWAMIVDRLGPRKLNAPVGFPCLLTGEVTPEIHFRQTPHPFPQG